MSTFYFFVLETEKIKHLSYPQGILIAKISKGRRIWEVVVATLFIPLLYIFLWIVGFGGTTIVMEREAAEEGLCCPEVNSEYTEPFFAQPDEMVSSSVMAGKIA